MRLAATLTPGSLLTGPLRAAACAIGAALLTCCASLPPPAHLEFLDHPPVTRDQTLAQLGPASSAFEADGVLTYRLGQSRGDYYVVPTEKHRGWERVDYDLVLAFDDAGLLEQRRWVPIRAPRNAR